MAFAEVRCTNATMCFAQVIPLRYSLVYAIKHLFRDSIEIFAE